MSDDGGLGVGAVESIAERVFLDRIYDIIVGIILGFVAAVIDATLNVLNALSAAFAATVLPPFGAAANGLSSIANAMLVLQASFASLFIGMGLAAPFAIASAWAVTFVASVAVVWFLVGLAESIPAVQTAVAAVRGALGGAREIVSVPLRGLFGGDNQ